MTIAAPVAPTMPARLRAEYDVSPDEMRIVFRPRSWGIAAFLALWLTGWTAGCVMLAREVITKPAFFSLLFAIPFWVSWIFVAALLVGFVARRQQLQVDSRELQYRDWALVRLGSRTVPRNELRGFAVVERKTGSDDSESAPQTGLEIRTAGQPLFVFAGLADAELEWLAHQLTQLVDPPATADAQGDAQPAAVAAAERYPQTLRQASDPIEPPSDCAWQLDRDFAALAFVERGRWKWSAVLGLLFVCAFWNGIVGVFVSVLCGVGPDKPPAGGEWWFLFFFLIPFEVIGLAMLGGLVLALLEPVRRRTWTFDARQIECRWTWFGLGPRWTYFVETLEGVDLIRGKRGRLRDKSAGTIPVSSTPSWGAEGSQFALSLVQPGGLQLCEIDLLTEGEARWMADVVLRERPEWFR